jgi:hypothetical protein
VNLQIAAHETTARAEAEHDGADRTDNFAGCRDEQ